MQSWITTVLLALASKAVMGAPRPMEATQPPALYQDCYWDARVCWCTNIDGYNVRVSDYWCYYEQDEQSWQANYGQQQEEEPEEEYEDEDEDEDEEEGEEEEEGEDSDGY
ncbi:hypothetical protein HOO65_090208 [Ceratocystis lukuohia]|uniref:Uncharacterized protein n=1 Tax=Ceratocystis lukuohia TaxID=2019550 RepID=A0ABR4M9J6_9PEZI